MQKRIKLYGFSLVELMIVLSIVGIIVSMALPKFKQLQYRARQAEAETNLNFIYTLQEAYYAEESRYGLLSPVGQVDSGSEHGSISNRSVKCTVGPGEFNEIGFKFANCSNVRYLYRAYNPNTIGFDGQQILGYAASSGSDGGLVCPGGENGEDSWRINSNKELTQGFKCDY